MVSFPAALQPLLAKIPWLRSSAPVEKTLPLWYQNQVLLAAIGLTVAIWLFQMYINSRQHRRLLQKEMPVKVSTLVSQEAFEKARLYSLDKSNFNFVMSLLTIIDLVFLMTYMHSKAWSWSVTLAGRYLGSSTSEIKVSLVFASIMILWSKVIGIPFSLYSTFVLERKHGFNRQTMGVFWSDQVKGLLLGVLFGFPLLVALIWIVRRFGETFYIAAWLLVLAFQTFLMLIFPTFIQPLFNKFDPLPEGPLRNKIQALAQKLKFPLSKIFVMDGSKRSSHSNAYFFGFFQKRIVLFDTLLNQNSEDEICAILGHELGHWKCWHNFQNFIVAQVNVFLMFYGYSRFVRQRFIFEAFGFTDPVVPVTIGFIIFGIFMGPANVVLGFLMNLFSRHNEFQADRFAVDLGYGELLQSALVKLQVENKGNLNPDPLYSAMNYSHPPLIERLEAIKKAMKKRA